MKRLVVIGGGAAGFFCAVNAARLNRQLEVILLEKTGKLLSKVKVSGGGRCNVTHHLFDIAEMSRRYPRGQNFVKKTFHQFFTTDTIQWFEDRSVKLKAEKDGRMFPVTDSSQTIINCLLDEATRYGVKLRLNEEVKAIRQIDDSFLLQLSSGDLPAGYVCVASGGYPKSGQFDWLRSLGHTIEDPVPSLFTFNLPRHPLNQLMGVSVELARVKMEGSKLSSEGPLLITHWGLSGPAVLKLSAWGARELASLNYRFRVHVNWLPHLDESDLKDQVLEQRSSHASRKLSNWPVPLPQRLWEFLLQDSGISHELRFSELPSKLENALVRNLLDYVVEVSGKTTFKEEFVTAGGIRLAEIDPNTMMSRKQKNLYFAGEIMDVDGITGGFNFQHAWTSGWIAARSIAGGN